MGITGAGAFSGEETKWGEGEGAQAVWGAEARAEDCFRKGGEVVSGTLRLH